MGTPGRPISSENYIHKKGSIYCSNLPWASGEWNNTRVLVVSDEVSIMSSIKAMLKSLLSQELFSKHKCDSQSSPLSGTGRHRRSPSHVQSVIRQAKSAESVHFMWVSRRASSIDKKIPHTWKNGQTKFLLWALLNLRHLTKKTIGRFGVYKMFPVEICWLYHALQRYQPLGL